MCPQRVALFITTLLTFPPSRTTLIFSLLRLKIKGGLAEGRLPSSFALSFPRLSFSQEPPKQRRCVCGLALEDGGFFRPPHRAPWVAVRGRRRESVLREEGRREKGEKTNVALSFIRHVLAPKCWSPPPSSAYVQGSEKRDFLPRKMVPST